MDLIYDTRISPYEYEGAPCFNITPNDLDNPVLWGDLNENGSLDWDDLITLWKGVRSWDREELSSIKKGQAKLSMSGMFNPNYNDLITGIGVYKGEITLPTWDELSSDEQMDTLKNFMRYDKTSTYPYHWDTPETPGRHVCSQYTMELCFFGNLWGIPIKRLSEHSKGRGHTCNAILIDGTWLRIEPQLDMIFTETLLEHAERTEAEGSIFDRTYPKGYAIVSEDKIFGWDFCPY